MSGLTEAGFSAKRLPELKTDIEGRLQEAFGDPDLREESIYGQLTGIQSELFALLWSLSEDVYGSQYPDTATGNSLDLVCSLTGVIRIPATPTQVTALAYGEPGTVLLAGRITRNPRTGHDYRTLDDVTISTDHARDVTININSVVDEVYTVTIDGADYTFPAFENTEAEILEGLEAAIVRPGISASAVDGGIRILSEQAFSIGVTSNIDVLEIGVEVPMLAVEVGPKLLPSGALTEIVTAVSGWSRVTNPDPGITGTNRETDAQLRARRERSIQITATNTLDAITARLLQTPLVTDVRVYENTGIETDATGTPRQHIWVVVEGGTDQDVAQTIYNTRAGGIGMRGDELVDVISPQTGRAYPVSFDRPTYQDVEILVIYTALPGAGPSVEQRIINALTAKTFRIGDPVIYSRMFGLITCEVPNVQIDDMTIDSQRVNITVAPNEKVRFLANRIRVERQ